jgi:hypothetical protein
MTTEMETGVMQLQVKGSKHHWPPLGARKRHRDSPSQPPEEPTLLTP